jgi:acid phosphatase family membrane protein YuiD
MLGRQFGGTMALIGKVFVDIVSNPTVWSGGMAWLVAQLTKLVCHFAMTRHVNFRYLVSTGGMPSAHSAMVCGIATSVGWHCGCSSPEFALAAAVASLIMFDAATVRRAAGLQAKVLNDMVDQFFKEHTLSEHKLKELLGHTRFEVCVGALMGVLVGIDVNIVMS